MIAYTENITAEHMCNGLVFSEVGLDGTEFYGSPITIDAAFQRALAHADSGLAMITGTTAADNRVRYALQVTKGRILLNLDRHAEAATAVAGVPTSYQYLINHTLTGDANQTWTLNNSARRYSVSTVEGVNGLDFATANDPRLPVCLGSVAGCTAGTQRNRDDNTPIPLYIQRKWPDQTSDVVVAGGVEARLIEAEAQLDAGNATGALTTLNALRAATGTGSGGVSGLTALTDPGTAAGRVDQLFRERAFWMFGTGHRTGDLRRLIRQYGRTEAQVFPTGAWHKQGELRDRRELCRPERGTEQPGRAAVRRDLHQPQRLVLLECAGGGECSPSARCNVQLHGGGDVLAATDAFPASHLDLPACIS